MPVSFFRFRFKTSISQFRNDRKTLLYSFRSRSHAARQKGIEVPPDADDGLSDQDVDPELSNSSSEMVTITFGISSAKC